MGRGSYRGGSTIVLTGRPAAETGGPATVRVGLLQRAAEEFDPHAEPQLVRKEDKEDRPRRRVVSPEVIKFRKKIRSDAAQARAKKRNRRAAALAKLESKRNRKKGRKGYPEET